VEWFTKSLLPLIARDVAMGGVVTEEEAIARVQYLDLVYSQSGTLYELIPNVKCTNTNPYKLSSTSHADGVIGSIKTQYVSQSIGMANRSDLTSTPSSTTPSSTSPQTQISEVNAVQSAPSQQTGGKKNTKNKKKRIITMNNQKLKTHHLLMKRNHNGN
jgi:hypothetical protein